VTSLAQDLSLEVPQPSTGSRPVDKHYVGHFRLRTIHLYRCVHSAKFGASAAEELRKQG
jgi:hypothetical protein